MPPKKKGEKKKEKERKGEKFKRERKKLFYLLLGPKKYFLIQAQKNCPKNLLKNFFLSSFFLPSLSPFKRNKKVFVLEWILFTEEGGRIRFSDAAEKREQ